MRRREILLALTGFGLAAAVSSRLLRASDEEGVAAIVFKRLKYLKLDPEGVREFARDYSATGVISSAKLRVVAAAGPLYRNLPLSGANPLANGIRHGEERIVTTFLLSSDFFLSGADEGNTVHYLRFFDALQGCRNPFARMVAQGAGTVQFAADAVLMEKQKCLTG
jgi:hypothetical protein